MRLMPKIHHVCHGYLNAADNSMCLDQMVRSSISLCVGVSHTVQLAQPSVIAEFRWWDSSSVVLYGAVAS